jgi:hypothetical protein
MLKEIIYGGSYTCTHDIFFKIKMLSYLEVAYVFNNIEVVCNLEYIEVKQILYE